ncbi:MAG: SHOCT domain-containing protein [Methanosphaera sp.]|uniref:SHOCT domain-containing protein n=1 Tax=Methanosphaera sp. TaxID=2666342 RepID=UPI0025E93944|nr:SHOCT domain-containing protein [Methanosphaera sp.]MCI5867732.1 SHOCT domain-containing protein [Methanosphaera sp.]MDD6535308.1 SHOCT domain-containing protein [Methanosphaera sp.]MDY3956470.1 SHOCT domain-containing protein [Methanosphaera sp.]
MSFFSKEEIDPELIPYINKGEAVGRIKLDGYGKCSVVLKGRDIIFTSYENKTIPRLNLSQILSLKLDEGNFLNEPKIYIGIGNQTLVLKGLDDNDPEFKRFYETILQMKQKEAPKQQPKNNSQMPKPKQGMPQPNHPLQQQTMAQQAPTQQAPMDAAPSMDAHPQQNMPFNDVKVDEMPVNNTPVVDENIDVVDEKKDPVDEIRRYYELKEDGIITQEEFEAKKKQLLDL